MKKFDVIIFAGQSNMQGQSEILSNADIVEHAYEYRYLANGMIPLQNPVGENIKYDMTEGYPFVEQTDLDGWLQDHTLGAACYGHTNLVPEFCHAYLNDCEENIDVLAVHAAKGSTCIAEWLPGTMGYDALMQKGKAAIEFAKQNGEIMHIFFVWLQGESDAILGITKQEYKEKLLLLNRSLREDLSVECFGIIRVGHFTKDKRDLEIIGAQSEVCQQENSFFMLTEVSTELNQQEEYMNPHVEGHYSAKGLEVLGTLSGKAFAAYRNELVKGIRFS